MTEASSNGQHRKAIAVTWEQHRRTQGLCAGLGIPLFELAHHGGRLARYVVLASRTLWLILRERPQVLLVQNPSLVLAMIAVVMRPFAGRYKLVVDAHNEAVQPFIHTRWPVPQLARWLLQAADLTIVTNQKLASVVARMGGRPFVLPDRLPQTPFVASAARTIDADFEVMVISTYAPDEPIAHIFAAAAALGSTFKFHVTGNDRKLAAADRVALPANVRLTGFLPEHDYWRLMDQCHVVLDLTLMPDCLVCGAYEALAMCRPMVLSDNPATRELFGDVSVLAGAGAERIRVAVLAARQCYTELCRVAPGAKAQFELNWSREAASLISRMS